MRGLWTHLERLGGGIGTRGPGESQIETDRRLARDRIAALRRRLEHVRGTRAVHARRARARRAADGRARRLHQRRQVDAAERAAPARRTGSRRCATASSTRSTPPRARHIGGRPYLLTDTVGFIRKLPHQLVDAFAATLEETRAGRAAPARARRLRAGGRAGGDAPRGRGDARGDRRRASAPRLLVLNKADLLDERRARGAAPAPPRRRARQRRQRRGPRRSSARGSSSELRTRCAPVELLVPYADGASLAELHELAGELARAGHARGGARARARARPRRRFALRRRLAPQRGSRRRRCLRARRALAREQLLEVAPRPARSGRARWRAAHVPEHVPSSFAIAARRSSRPRRRRGSPSWRARRPRRPRREAERRVGATHARILRGGRESAGTRISSTTSGGTASAAVGASLQRPGRLSAGCAARVGCVAPRAHRRGRELRGRPSAVAISQSANHTFFGSSGPCR